MSSNSDETLPASNLKLSGAYVFNQPTLHVDNNVVVTASPRPKLVKPYQLSLQTGVDSTPLVGILATSFSDLSTIDGDFGERIRGLSENDDVEKDEEVEFRPYRHKPLIKVKSTTIEKKSSDLSD